MSQGKTQTLHSYLMLILPPKVCSALLLLPRRTGSRGHRVVWLGDFCSLWLPLFFWPLKLVAPARVGIWFWHNPIDCQGQRVNPPTVRCQRRCCCRRRLCCHIIVTLSLMRFIKLRGGTVQILLNVAFCGTAWYPLKVQLVGYICIEKEITMMKRCGRVAVLFKRV